jgi:hypothetical protein
MKKNDIFCILKVREELGTDQHLHPDLHRDPLVRGTGPGIQIRIRIRTKMSWIRNTAALSR